MAAVISFKANLGKNAEYKEVPKGGEVHKIVTFSACETTYRTNQETGEIEGSDDIWYQVSFFGEKAHHYSRVLKKGMRVRVEGTFKPGKPYEDNEGNYQNSFAVNAQEITLCITQRVESVILKEKEGS